jgi:hypothetical protein
MDPETITIEQALLAINDHLWEEVRVELYTDDRLFSHGMLELNGELSRIDTIEGAASAGAAERDYMAGAYMIGAQSIHVGSLPGSITSNPNGITFHLADGLSLGLTWDDGQGTA